ncbi:MAG TPA: GNAT family protein, partial [Anaerolineales bacterium]
SAELGIMLGEKTLWGRGYGTDTMRILVRHGFDTLNLNRIFLRVYESNLRAMRVYDRLGFREEGRLRQDHYVDGTYEDTVIMGLLCEEWRSMARDGR